MTVGFKRGDHVEIAQRVLQRLENNHENLVYDDGRFYRYEETGSCAGLWRPIDEDDLARIVIQLAGTRCKTAKAGRLHIGAHDINGAIRIAGLALQQKATSYFSQGPKGVRFNNGFAVVTAEKIELRGHSRENRARQGLPFNYDPEAAKSKKLLGFVEGLFRDDPDRKEKAGFIQELFGASLVGAATVYQKCALLLGDGENGKDTLLEVLKVVFPKDSVCAIPPKRFSHEYSVATLGGKLLNSVAELPNTKLESTEDFKSVITGSPMVGRFPYGREFNVIPIAGHVFAANSTMGTPDLSHGFFRRFGIVKFNRRFVGKEANPRIREEMTATLGDESAVVSWLLEGARRLFERGRYILPESHEKELQEWRSEADTVALWVDAEMRPAKEGEKWCNGANAYGEYATWSEINGHRRLASVNFGKRLKMLLRERNAQEEEKTFMKKSGGLILYALAKRKRGEEG